MQSQISSKSKRKSKVHYEFIKKTTPLKVLLESSSNSIDDDLKVSPVAEHNNSRMNDSADKNITLRSLATKFYTTIPEEQPTPASFDESKSCFSDLTD